MDSKELSSISDCFGDQKAIKTPKLNMLIGLKGDNYCSKVFKRVNYKLWNSPFWVVINRHSINQQMAYLRSLTMRSRKDQSISINAQQASQSKCHVSIMTQNPTIKHIPVVPSQALNKWLANRNKYSTTIHGNHMSKHQSLDTKAHKWAQTMGQSTYLGSLAKCCNEGLVNTWQTFFKQTSQCAQAKHSQ